MNTYILQTDHQGMQANTRIIGPTLITGSENTYGYFPEGVSPDSKYCFFASYVEGNPSLFVEQKSPQLES